ncbi:iron uptake transporter permease EfeU [Varibaculum vaginae]|uniref:iron uptake transporter permease EfeU n=1 Tax=Varibaculum vaginae TaxID=2364797 RepID=UPI000F0774EC|nr:iron uptake transporter permease EfeU [Varibaculum vaginae]
MLGALLIALREGLEAVLIVSILYAYVKKVEREDVLPKLWLGIAVGAVVPMSVGAYLVWGTYTLTTQAQEALGGFLSLFAVGLITWMIFWMAEHSAEMTARMQSQVKQALAKGSGAGWSLFVIALITVGREGLETAIFIWPMLKNASDNENGTSLVMGMLLGIAIAIALGYLIYRGVARINLRIFFEVTGYLLIFVAAGVCSYGFHDLQEAGVIPMTAPLFDITANIPTLVYNGGLYDLLVAIFQFSPSPTSLQFFSWLIYLVVVATLFYFYNRNKKLALAAKPSPKEESATIRESASRVENNNQVSSVADQSTGVGAVDNKTKTSVEVG